MLIPFLTQLPTAGTLDVAVTAHLLSWADSHGSTLKTTAEPTVSYTAFASPLVEMVNLNCTLSGSFCLINADL